MSQLLVSNLLTKDLSFSELVKAILEFILVLIGLSYISGVSSTLGVSYTKVINNMANPTTIIAHGKKISHISPLRSLLKYLTLFKKRALKWRKNKATGLVIRTLARSKLSNSLLSSTIKLSFNPTLLEGSVSSNI